MSNTNDMKWYEMKWQWNDNGIVKNIFSLRNIEYNYGMDKTEINLLKIVWKTSYRREKPK